MTLKNLSGKVVLITGAGAGIGRETALLCASRGAVLVLCDRDDISLKQTTDDARVLGSEVFAHTVDVSDAQAMDAFADAVHARYEAVDLLINNAGIGVLAGFFDTEPEDWDRQIAVNIKGVVHGCERFIPRMIARGRGGHVVNVSSAAGYLAASYMCAYSTTKYAVTGLSEALRIDLRPHRIGVTTICPGPINTSITRTSVARGADADEHAARVAGLHERRGYPPERVAANILHAVARNRAVAPVSPEAHLMWLLARFSPPAARWFGARASAVFG